jgi:hypothetical protein
MSNQWHPSWTSYECLVELLRRTGPILEENERLRARVKELEQSIEDICVGSCPECPPNWKQEK